jgi:hypothetical protein
MNSLARLFRMFIFYNFKKLVLLLCLIFINCSKEVESNCNFSNQTFQSLFILNQITKQFDSICNLRVLNRTSNSPSPIQISGTISGLISKGLVIQNNNANDLSIEFGSTSFSFPTPVLDYDVTIKSNPFNLTCTIANSKGTSNSVNVNNVNINCRLKELIISGIVTNFAGSGTGGNIDGVGTSAQLNSPYGIVFDGTDLYFSDFGSHRIRKVNPTTALVTTQAGSSIGFADGIGTSAQFNIPGGVSTDFTSIYISDNSNNRIRRMLIANNQVSLLAGSGVMGGVDAIGASAQFNGNDHVLFDGKNLFVSEFQSDRIRKIDLITSQVSTILTGPDGPTGMAYDGTNLYFSAYNENKIKRFNTTTNVLTDIATVGFNNPLGLLLTGESIYICDRNNNSLKRFNIASNSVSTIATSLNQPIAVTTDGRYLYVTSFGGNRILRIE